MDEQEALLASSRIPLERWIKAHIGPVQDAEDILQDTWVAALEGLPTLRSKDAFLPWVLGIARRKCADWYRRQSRSPVILTQRVPEASVPGPEETFVEETLSGLPAPDRTMLRLFYLDNLSQREIAQALQIPEGTVKSRMHTARMRFRAAYPVSMQGGITMEKNAGTTLPPILPAYSIVWTDKPVFSVDCEELEGWFIVPRLGEKLVWGIYDLPSRRLDIAYAIQVTGPGRVHGLDGVSILAKVLSARSDFSQNDPVKDAVDASTGGQEEWVFIAQAKDGYTRFLSAEHVENGVRTISTFLDGDAFMDSWGFGEENCGAPIHRKKEGKILRQGCSISVPPESRLMDLVGRCDLLLNGVHYDTVCLMDLDMYQEGMVTEQYLNAQGQTILWRRFNRDDWAVDRYGKTWSALLPDNEQLTINGQRYVHWYDCLCLR
ncbi:MAG: RNA polymerase sigma factor [Clostridia bacterium]|nr:RNA polymerase sigma factor [Clostridia bacterium]